LKRKKNSWTRSSQNTANKSNNGVKDMTTNETFVKFIESKCNVADRISIIKKLLDNDEIYGAIQDYIFDNLEADEIDMIYNSKT